MNLSNSTIRMITFTIVALNLISSGRCLRVSYAPALALWTDSENSLPLNRSGAQEVEPIYGVCVTGKSTHRTQFFKNSVISFFKQTYEGTKILVVINTGVPIADDVHRLARDQNIIREIFITQTENTTLGDLRNAAYAAIPLGALWVQWDDDDWHHHEYLAKQQSHLDNDGIDRESVSYAEKQVVVCLLTNKRYVRGPFGHGIAGTIMTRLQPHYASLRKGEDSVVQTEFQHKGTIKVWNNPAHMYIRMIHAWGTTDTGPFCGKSAQPLEIPSTGGEVPSYVENVVQSYRSGGEVPSYVQNVVQSYKSFAPPRFAVLLSMHISDARKSMYEQRLAWWLKKTHLPIYVVDSGNLSFDPSLRKIRDFNEFHFNQTSILDIQPNTWGLPTLGEMLSMQLAWNTFKPQWAQFDYIVKVTGKYVLPDLEVAMVSIPPRTDIIIQHFGLSNPHTECIGFRSSKFIEFLSELQGMTSMDSISSCKRGVPRSCGIPILEARIPRLISSNRTYFILPPMRIPAEYRVPRGGGEDLLEATAHNVLTEL